jgi:(p)ppGpp synthase/HD superfamily hydrolase
MKSAERKILSLIISFLLIVGFYGCGASHPVTTENANELRSGYEITIRCVDNSNPIGKLMQVFLEAGIVVTRMQQREMDFDRYELHINVKPCSSDQLSTAEGRLRNLVNVESFVVRRG